MNEKCVCKISLIKQYSESFGIKRKEEKKRVKNQYEWKSVTQT